MLRLGALLPGLVSTADAKDGWLVRGLRQTVAERERERDFKACICVDARVCAHACVGEDVCVCVCVCVCV